MIMNKLYLLLLCWALSTAATAQIRQSAVSKPDTIFIYDTVIQTVTVQIHRASMRPRSWTAVAPLPVTPVMPVVSSANLHQHGADFLSLFTATFRPVGIIELDKKSHVHKIATMKKRNFLSLAFLALVATPSLHGQRFILHGGAGYAQTTDARIPIRHFPFLRLGWAGPRSEFTAGLQLIHYARTLPMVPNRNLNVYQEYYHVESFQTDITWLRVLATIGRVRLSGGGGAVWSRSTVNTLDWYTLKPQTEIVKSAQFLNVVHHQIGGILKTAVDVRVAPWLYLTATGGYLWLPGTPSAPVERHQEDLLFAQLGLKLALGK
jgi:hypothetical protein